MIRTCDLYVKRWYSVHYTTPVGNDLWDRFSIFKSVSQEWLATTGQQLPFQSVYRWVRSFGLQSYRVVSSCYWPKLLGAGIAMVSRTGPVELDMGPNCVQWQVLILFIGPCQAFVNDVMKFNFAQTAFTQVFIVWCTISDEIRAPISVFSKYECSGLQSQCLATIPSSRCIELTGTIWQYVYICTPWTL